MGVAKVIKVSQCGECPYCNNRSSVERGHDRKCSAVDPDEEGYGVDLTAILMTVPAWRPLDDEDGTHYEDAAYKCEGCNNPCKIIVRGLRVDHPEGSSAPSHCPFDGETDCRWEDARNG